VWVGVSLRNNEVAEKELRAEDARKRQLTEEPRTAEAGEQAGEEKVSAWGYLWPRAMLLAVAAIWGTNFGVIKLLDESLRTSASAAGRFGLAALALSPALINAPREVVMRGLGLGNVVFMGYFLQANALRESESNKIAFLCSLAVVFVPLINKLFPEKDAHAEKKSAPLLSILLAVSGVGLLELSSSTAPGFGDFLGLLQALAFACGFVGNERAMNRYPGSAIALSAAQLASVAGLSAVWYFFDSVVLYGSFDLQGITVAAGDPLVLGALLYTGLITTGLAVVLENFSLQKVSASELTVLLSTEPFFAAAFSAFFLNESLTSQGIAGGMLIIAACLSNQMQGAAKSALDSKWLRWLPWRRAKAGKGE